MSFFSSIVNAEHSFCSWAEKELLKLEGAAPTIERIADTVLTYVGPALQTVVSLEAGSAAGAVVAKVIATVQSDITAASGLITDFGASPSVSSILKAVTSNLGTLLTDAGVKDAKSVNAVNKVITELNVLEAAITALIPAVTAPPVPPPA
jgi:hypothetical protein